MNSRRRSSTTILGIVLPAGFAGVAVWLSLVGYRPDRPVAAIEPGSSPGPTFVVQIIRPRLGLPLGGILPPQLFGLDARVGFDSADPGAVARVGTDRYEFRAGPESALILADASGRPTAGTHAVFEMVFEDRDRTVRCRPAEPPAGTLATTPLAGASEISGRFDIELVRCEDARTGEPLGWPPRPLTLHGSFDRIPRGDRGG